MSIHQGKKLLYCRGWQKPSRTQEPQRATDHSWQVLVLVQRVGELARLTNREKRVSCCLFRAVDTK